MAKCECRREVALVWVKPAAEMEGPGSSEGASRSGGIRSQRAAGRVGGVVLIVVSAM